ncbi:TAFII28-domain-containing protein, partial [Caulochytrium protostelioides]
DEEQDGAGLAIEVLPQTAEDREALMALMAHFTPTQQAQYEAYRRSHLSRAGMKKLAQQNMGVSSVPPSAGIVVAGCAKLFVGELVEKALEIMEDWGDSGPIQPEHIRAAIKEQSSKSKKRRFY